MFQVKAHRVNLEVIVVNGSKTTYYVNSRLALNVHVHFLPWHQWVLVIVVNGSKQLIT